MRDQAANLRDLMNLRNSENVRNSPLTIAITSGKGGVGKTNITVNLALQLGILGKKVIILDADLGLANAEVLLGLVPAYSMYDVFTGRKNFADVVVQAPFGVKLIPGGSGFMELANLRKYQLEMLLENLKSFVTGYDFLLIDTGAGISKNVLGFVSAAQEVIVVVTPEPTSLTDAYSMIKILSNYKIHPTVNIIVNRATNMAEVEQTKKKIDLVTGKFLQIGVRHLGHLLEDNAVRKAVKEQQPFRTAFPHANVSQDMYQITKNLLEIKGENSNGISRLISKLKHLFG